MSFNDLGIDETMCILRYIHPDEFFFTNEIILTCRKFYHAYRRYPKLLGLSIVVRMDLFGKIYPNHRIENKYIREIKYHPSWMVADRQIYYVENFPKYEIEQVIYIIPVDEKRVVFDAFKYYICNCRQLILDAVLNKSSYESEHQHELRRQIGLLYEYRDENIQFPNLVLMKIIYYFPEDLILYILLAAPNLKYLYIMGSSHCIDHDSMIKEICITKHIKYQTDIITCYDSYSEYRYLRDRKYNSKNGVPKPDDTD